MSLGRVGFLRFRGGREWGGVSVGVIRGAVHSHVLGNRNFIAGFMSVNRKDKGLGGKMLRTRGSSGCVRTLDGGTAFLSGAGLVPSRGRGERLSVVDFSVRLRTKEVGKGPRALSSTRRPAFASTDFSTRRLETLAKLRHAMLCSSVRNGGFVGALAGAFTRTGNLTLREVLLCKSGSSASSSTSSNCGIVSNVLGGMGAGSRVDVRRVSLATASSGPLGRMHEVFSLFPSGCEISNKVTYFMPPMLGEALCEFMTSGRSGCNERTVVAGSNSLVVRSVPVVNVPRFDALHGKFAGGPMLLARGRGVR